MKVCDIKQMRVNRARYHTDEMIRVIEANLVRYFVAEGKTEPYTFVHSSSDDYIAKDVNDATQLYFRTEGWNVDYDSSKRSYTFTIPNG